MLLETLVNSFRKEKDLPPCESDKQGRYYFTVDGKHRIACYQKKNKLLLIADIGKLPEDDLEKKTRLKKLLQVSLARQKKTREALIYNQSIKTFEIYRHIPIDTLQNYQFAQEMKEFAAAVAYWNNVNKSETSPLRNR